MYASNTLTESLAVNLAIESTELEQAIETNIYNESSSAYFVREMLTRFERLARANEYLAFRLSRSELN